MKKIMLFVKKKNDAIACLSYAHKVRLKSFIPVNAAVVTWE